MVSRREGAEPNSLHFLDLEMQYGYYEDVQHVVTEMNNTIVSGTSDDRIRDVLPQLCYAGNTRRVTVTFPRGGYILLSEELAAILGFSTKLNRHPAPGGSLEGDRVSDVRGGMHGMYVYCDVLENVPVGDSLAPLLRIVDVEGLNGDTIHRTFVHPRYVPLQKKEFDSIEIDIRDDTGAPVPFESGKLVVTLHFKRASNPYLI